MWPGSNRLKGALRSAMAPLPIRWTLGAFHTIADDDLGTRSPTFESQWAQNQDVRTMASDQEILARLRECFVGILYPNNSLCKHLTIRLVLRALVKGRLSFKGRRAEAYSVRRISGQINTNAYPLHMFACC